MQKTPVSVTIPLSGNRSVTFTALNGRVQVIGQGYIHPCEIASAKLSAIQKLADVACSTIRDGGEIYTPRRDPANPGRNYQTRLLRRPVGGGRCRRTNDFNARKVRLHAITGGR